MRTSTLMTVLATANAVHAFPDMDALTAPLRAEAVRRFAEADAVQRRGIVATRAGVPPQGASALPSIPPPFDAKAQYVSNQGEYAFVAPTANDSRGMCPGLNAMANHGYLPHNGRATIAQFTEATQRVFGMGPDLALFLAVLGGVVDGDGLAWSLGGAPHVGIGGSHGNYETDSSPLKSDLYQYGSNGKLILTQFKELYDMQPDAATANYNIDVLRAFRAKRFNESISQNPYFYYAPFAGIAVSQAAFTFIYRFMSNKSAENPEGILNKEVLKSFHSITGNDSDPVWTFGHERIPDNWYKRNEADAYTIPYFITDISYLAQTDPYIIGTGCNQGQVNTYISLDLSKLTGGAYTEESAKASPFCLATEYAHATLPLLSGLTGSLTPLLNAFKNVSSTLNCAPITAVDTSATEGCPGFSLYGGPTAPVAPGAVQNP